VDQPAITPAEAGFAMPAAWARHAATLMAWPCRTELWRDLMDRAKDDYASVARAVARFEPVLMACPPGASAEVRRRGGVIVPLSGDPAADATAMGVMAAAYPGREVVGVPGTVLDAGGGGPHCITQPIPAGPIATA
jgi:agmatine/peptidylarginine deiminase